MTGNPRLAPGQARQEFDRLAELETDECVIWPYAKGGPRRYGQVYIDGRKTYCHREALARRQPMPSEHHEVAHGPCNRPACMNYRHLRWATHAENEADKHRDGTTLHGTRNPMARLTPDAVTAIRRLYARGGLTQAALADAFGVTTMTINRAVRHQSWTVLQ